MGQVLALVGWAVVVAVLFAGWFHFTVWLPQQRRKRRERGE